MLDPSDFYKGITQGVEGITDLCEKVNYHADYPQNHNILLTNNSSAVCRIYDGANWSTLTRRDLWIRIMQRHYQWCDAFIKVYKEYIDEKTLENYDKLKSEIRPGMKWIRKNFGLNIIQMAMRHKKMIKQSTKEEVKLKEIAKEEAQAIQIESAQTAL